MRPSPRFQPPWTLPTSVQAGPTGQGGKGVGDPVQDKEWRRDVSTSGWGGPSAPGLTLPGPGAASRLHFVTISPTRRSLMIQGLGIHLPEQVQSLFQEDPKSHGETAHELQLLKPTGREPRACSEGGHRDGKPKRRDEDPSL